MRDASWDLHTVFLHFSKTVQGITIAGSRLSFYYDIRSAKSKKEEALTMGSKLKRLCSMRFLPPPPCGHCLINGEIHP